MAITLNLTTGHTVTTIENDKNKDKNFGEIFNSYDANGDGLDSKELTSLFDDNVKITSKGLFNRDKVTDNTFAVWGLMLPCVGLNNDSDEEHISLEEIEKFTGYSFEELSQMDINSAVEALIKASGFMEK